MQHHHPYQKKNTTLPSMVCLMVTCSIGVCHLLTPTWAEPIPSTLTSTTPTTAAAEAPLVVHIRNDVIVYTDDIDEAEQQVADNPDNPEAYFMLAVTYSRTPFLEKAYMALNQAKKRVLKRPKQYGHLDELLQELQDALVYDSANKSLRYRLAMAYFAKGYGLEEGSIPWTADLSSTDPVLREEHASNKTDAIRAYYRRAVGQLEQLAANDPQDFAARNYLAFLLIQLDEVANLPRATALLEESQRLMPDNPAACVLLSEVYMKAKNLPKAMESLARGAAVRVQWENARNKPKNAQ